MLLPSATSPAQKSQLHVAVLAEDGRIVGAAALGLDCRPTMYHGWRVDLRVIVPFRGRGIGRALVGHVAAQARGHGIAAVHAWEWVEPESDAARAWAALGFGPCQQKLEFEADLARAASHLRPLYDKLREENWIPQAARIIPLRDADPEAVAQLHAQHLGGSRRLLMPLLRGAAADCFDPTYSRVLLLDGRVMGFTLGRILPGGVCEIDANVVHPSLRLGWANLWLKYEAAELLLAAGVHTIRYSSFQQHTDTRRISRQVGGRLVRALFQMRRDLTTPGP
jgi:N-acetylglutamate synthase-like GNAT family acetyltransferase